MAITTLIPGEGWFAVRQYKDTTIDPPEVKSQIYPVIGFALIDGEICPMVTTVNKSNNPIIMSVTQMPGYEGIYHSSESAHIRPDKTVVFVRNTLVEPEVPPNG